MSFGDKEKEKKKKKKRMRWKTEEVGWIFISIFYLSSYYSILTLQLQWGRNP